MEELKPPIVTNNDAVVRRSRMRVANGFYAFAVASLLGVCPAAIALFAAFPRSDGVGMLLAMATFAVPIVAFVLGARESEGRVIGKGARIEHDKAVTLRDDADTRIDRADMKQGYSLANGIGVAIETRDNVRYQIVLPSSDSETWLGTLGLDAKHKLFRARFHRIFNQILFWMLGAPTIIGAAVWLGLTASEGFPQAGGASVWISLAAGLGASLFASMRWMGSEVIVGADGLTLRDGLFRRFVAYSTIASVGVSNGELVLMLVDGSSQRCWIDGDAGSEIATLYQRIEEARLSFARGGGANPAAQLSREGRSIAEWRAALTRMLDPNGGYREVRIDAEALVRVLSDPSAPVEHRVAAALALGGDDRYRERVRVVTAALADERVRVALESAADGRLDDDQFDRAIESAKVRVDAT